MRTKNLKSHVTDHVIFLLTCYFQQWTFFPILPVLLMFDTFRRKWQSSKMEQKRARSNFDGLEQKPKESNVTLITSYPSKETLFVKLLLLFTFSKLTYRFSLFNYKPKDLSRFLRMVGVAFFAVFNSHFFSKHHHQASFEVLRNRRLQSIFIKQVGGIKFFTYNQVLAAKKKAVF